MIALLAAAFALTPADLEQALPEARSTLEACARQGCADGTHARAAWLVAVGTYLDTGLADPELSAIVYSRDTTLFRTFPEILQIVPPPAQNRSSTPSPVELRPTILPAPTVVPAGPPPTGKPRTLVVRVRSTSGDLVPGAFVRVIGEPDRHRVNVLTGEWSETTIYGVDGDQPFRTGRSYFLLVGAPGHALQRVRVDPRKRRHRVDVTLTAAPSPQASSDLGRQALDRLAHWSALELSLVEDPVDSTYTALISAREDAMRALRDWKDADGGAVARDLCLMVGTHETCGASPLPFPTLVLGSRAVAEVDAVLEAIDVDACAPGSALVDVKLIVAPDGTVTRSEGLGSTLHHTGAEACVAGALALAHFPAGTGIDVVRKTVQLHP